MPLPTELPSGYYLTRPSRGVVILNHDDCADLASFDCEGSAICFAHDREDERAEEASEASADALAIHVSDFLSALDRGDFGSAHRFSDGSESAFVTGLRDGLAQFKASGRSAITSTATTARPVAQQAA